jgi:hypothetical protein
MFSTKIRTTIIALVAAFSFAGAATVPTVSQAAPNTGGFQKSNEGFKWSVQQCEQWGQLFEKYVNEAGKAYEAEGNSENFKNKLGAANMALSTAQMGGCAWSARVLPPGGPVSVQATVVPLQMVSP